MCLLIETDGYTDTMACQQEAADRRSRLQMDEKAMNGQRRLQMDGGGYDGGGCEWTEQAANRRRMI